MMSSFLHWLILHKNYCKQCERYVMFKESLNNHCGLESLKTEKRQNRETVAIAHGSQCGVCLRGVCTGAAGGRSDQKKHIIPQWQHSETKHLNCVHNYASKKFALFKNEYGLVFFALFEHFYKRHIFCFSSCHVCK